MAAVTHMRTGRHTNPEAARRAMEEAYIIICITHTHTHTHTHMHSLAHTHTHAHTHIHTHTYTHTRRHTNPEAARRAMEEAVNDEQLSQSGGALRSCNRACELPDMSI